MVNTSSKKRPRENSPSSDESETENEFQVEAIMDKRMRGKKIQYFLKWKGYSEADNTWEDMSNLNCPDLVKEFEENLKKKTTERKSNTKTESKTKKKTTNRSKKAKLYESNEDHQDAEQTSTSQINDVESSQIDANDTYESLGAPISNGHESSKKSHLSSTSKGENVDDDIIEENQTSNNENNATTISEDDNNNNNNSSIELLNKSSPTKESLLAEKTNEPPVNLRLRITPSSASSISLTLNDSDNNNNNTNEKLNIDNSINIVNEYDTSETINEDEEPVEKIEGVKNDQDGISFRIKLAKQNETQWISAKIANRKYPQAVIAFWESHVEFT